MLVPLIALAAIHTRPDHHAATRSEQREGLGHNWSAVAECESGGDWQANTGNSFYGGLQEALPTWNDYGGLTFAARPDLASRTEQIRVAERVLAVQGPGAWPICSVHLWEAA